VAVCPVDVIFKDPDRVESQAVLHERYRLLVGDSTAQP
jgi:hypothetical protein